MYSLGYSFSEKGIILHKLHIPRVTTELFLLVDAKVASSAPEDILVLPEDVLLRFMNSNNGFMLEMNVFMKGAINFTNISISNYINVLIVKRLLYNNDYTNSAMTTLVKEIAKNGFTEDSVFDLEKALKPDVHVVYRYTNSVIMIYILSPSTSIGEQKHILTELSHSSNMASVVHENISFTLTPIGSLTDLIASDGEILTNNPLVHNHMIQERIETFLEDLNIIQSGIVINNYQHKYNPRLSDMTTEILNNLKIELDVTII